MSIFLILPKTTPHTVSHIDIPQPIKPIKKVAKKIKPTLAKVAKATKPPAEKAPLPPHVYTAQYALGCANYLKYFRQYVWNVSVAVAICQAESTGNPYAISPPNWDGLRDYGLMQIHGQYILDPAKNIAAAYQKYVNQGWNAWTTYNTGAYLQYL